MTPTRALALVLTLAATQARAQFCPLGETERRIVLCTPKISMAACKAAALKVGCDVVRELALLNAVVIEIPTERMTIASVKIAKNPDFTGAYEDKKVHWLKNLPDFAPGDVADLTKRMRNLQPAFAAAPSGPQPIIPWGVERVGAPKAWSRTQGLGAAIAVIDTGIDPTHPDLAGQIAGGVNVLDAQHPDNWKDDEGHGTHVSGTIAANGLNGGYSGVAPKAKLYAVKVLDSDGNGTYSDVITGIQWAVDHGIKIANMSLGADEGSDALHQAVQAALAKGLLIIAAAGNSGGPVGYPGAYPEVVAVAASDSADHLATFSNNGAGLSYIAPGVDIMSLKLGGGYTSMSGTSMASPHVSGLAALAFAEGSTTPQALRAALDKAARPIAGLTPDQEGHGMVLAGDLLPATAGGATLAMARD
jgi:subtilisin